MRQAGGGRIVNILNTGAKTPAARSLPTSVSRAAGLALTKALSKELAPDRILVNAVCIGLVKSGQWERRWAGEGRPGTIEAFYERLGRELGVPLGRMGEAEELGALVARSSCRLRPRSSAASPSTSTEATPRWCRSARVPGAPSAMRLDVARRRVM